MTCYKPGERSRLIYAIREYRGRKDQPKGFGWKDYRDLVLRARTQLGGPIVLVWDNLRMHLVAPLREFFEANADWLTVFQLPTYAPDLNPQEGIWSLVKRDIGNLAAADLGQVTRAVKRKLKIAPAPAGGHRRLPGGHGSDPVGVIVRRSRRSEPTRWAAEHARAVGSARRSRSPAVPRQSLHSRAQPTPG
ncbi:transposase [Streptomyces sp. NPDC056453]|uniref:transposase n=1 Tax=Streptomyces sp. NPDC056453 TaxID=3345822 RepID=UPI00368316AF